MTTPAGDYNRRVVLQAPNPTRGTDGSLIEGWTDAATVWAAFNAIGGREVFETGKITGEVSHRLRIRYRPGVTNRWRVRMDDTSTSPATARSFKIVAALNPLDGRTELHLMVKELPDGEPT